MNIGEAVKYLTDKATHDTLQQDIALMWAIWDQVEFGNELQMIPVYPVDATTATRYLPNDELQRVGVYQLAKECDRKCGYDLARRMRATHIADWEAA